MKPTSPIPPDVDELVALQRATAVSVAAMLDVFAGELRELVSAALTEGPEMAARVGVVVAEIRTFAGELVAACDRAQTQIDTFTTRH